MSWQYGREQRLARRLALTLVAIGLVLGGPLIFAPGLRLSLGQQLGLVPGRKATRIFSGSAQVELIVLTDTVPVAGSLPSRRFTAVGVVERRQERVLLHDLTGKRTTTMPLTNYDLIAASADYQSLLFVDRADPGAPHAVLVRLDTGEVRPLPTGVTDPGLPGNWSEDVSDQRVVCDGVSPHETWVACVDRGNGFSRFVFGDWEVQISPFGVQQQTRRLYRGRGLLPIVGWTADESALYVQDDQGIWRIRI